MGEREKRKINAGNIPNSQQFNLFLMLFSIYEFPPGNFLHPPLFKEIIFSLVNHLSRYKFAALEFELLRALYGFAEQLGLSSCQKIYYTHSAYYLSLLYKVFLLMVIKLA